MIIEKEPRSDAEETGFPSELAEVLAQNQAAKEAFYLIKEQIRGIAERMDSALISCGPTGEENAAYQEIKNSKLPDLLRRNDSGVNQVVVFARRQLDNLTSVLTSSPSPADPTTAQSNDIPAL